MDNGLNELSRRCREANDTWWRDPLTGEVIPSRNVGELLMLCVSELSEAMEGHRKDLMDDKLPHCQLDLSGAFEEKMDFNSRRADHKPSARLAAGGKKY